MAFRCRRNKFLIWDFFFFFFFYRKFKSNFSFRFSRHSFKITHSKCHIGHNTDEPRNTLSERTRNQRLTSARLYFHETGRLAKCTGTESGSAVAGLGREVTIGEQLSTGTGLLSEVTKPS